MSRVIGTLKRLERQAARRNLGRVLPIKILTYGDLDGNDGLYHAGDRTYTEEEMTALQADYQLVIVTYGDGQTGGDGPPGDGRHIQMTWGDE